MKSIPETAPTAEIAVDIDTGEPIELAQDGRPADALRWTPAWVDLVHGRLYRAQAQIDRDPDAGGDLLAVLRRIAAGGER